MRVGFNQLDRIQVNRLRGAIDALDAFVIDGNWIGQHFKARREHFMALQRTCSGRDFEYRQRRNHPKIVRPEHADETFSQLGLFIVEFLAQTSNEKRKTFEQAFDVRIALPDAVDV